MREEFFLEGIRIDRSATEATRWGDRRIKLCSCQPNFQSTKRRTNGVKNQTHNVYATYIGGLLKYKKRATSSARVGIANRI